MADHDSPIQLNLSGGTLAKQIVSAEDGGHWPLPEGAVLASGVRRTAAFTVDVVIVTTILMVLTKSQIINAWNVTLWTSADFHYALAHASAALIAPWLYLRRTGPTFPPSPGKRWFGRAAIA